MLRLLLLFAGVVLMISGCNGLLSSQFGTQKLRTLSLEEVEAQGLGDADYVRIIGGEIGDAGVNLQLRGKNTLAVMRPLLASPGRQDAVRVVVWTEAQTSAWTYVGDDIEGMVEEPVVRKPGAAKWAAENIILRSPSIFIHLGEKPAGTPVHLLLFFGGLALAIVPELYHHRSAD